MSVFRDVCTVLGWTALAVGLMATRSLPAPAAPPSSPVPVAPIALRRLPPADEQTDPSPSDIPVVPRPQPSPPVPWNEPTPLPSPPTRSPASTPAPSEPFAWGVSCQGQEIYGQVDFLHLHRSAGSGSVPLLADAGTGDVLLAGSTLDFGFQPAMRANVGLRPNDLIALELGYLGFFPGEASAVRSATNFPGATMSLPGPLGASSAVFAAPDQVTSQYSTSLHSGEINWVCGCGEELGYGLPTDYAAGYSPTFHWFTGLRYLAIDERLSLTGERAGPGGTALANYQIHARNDLYGAQAGASLRGARGRWSGEVGGRAGLYANQASQAQSASDLGGAVLRAPVSASDSGAAFVGELEFTIARQIHAHWFLRCGYQLLWVQGIALAPSQLDYSLNSDAGAWLTRNDGLFLHGWRVGVESRW